MTSVNGKFDTFALAYGSITVLGGIIGYLKAGSVASLVSSTIFGGTILYASTQLPPVQGAKVMLAVSAILGVFFVPRFLNSFKVMPAGLMSALSGYAIFKYSKDLGFF